MEKIRGKSLKEWKEYCKEDKVPLNTMKYIIVLEERLEAINNTHCCTELKDNPKLNFGDWKFSQGLRYMSDFTYKNAKGELFDVDVVNKTYDDYYNL
jgi:hypothetical protein